MTTKRKVVVLFNRDYDEADVDYLARADVEKTAHAIAAAIDSSKDLTAALVSVNGSAFDFIERLRAEAPALVFNLCETVAARAESEPVIPAVLDLLGLPYTGSGLLTLATAVRKDRTKELLLARQVPTPSACVIDGTGRAQAKIQYPAIVKPVSEDGSLGIDSKSVVKNAREMQRQAAVLIERYRKPVLVESYVEGREIVVPLMQKPGGEFESLPWTEIDFSEMPKALPKIVTYAGKWQEDTPEYRGTQARVNPTLPAAVRKKIHAASVQAFSALECRGYARVDLRLDARGVPHVIDVNPNCDLSPGGGFFRACKAKGMSYADMVLALVDNAFSLSGGRHDSVATGRQNVHTRRLAHDRAQRRVAGHQKRRVRERHGPQRVG